MATKTKTTHYEEALRSLEQAAAELDTDYDAVKQELLIPAIEAVAGKSLSAFKRRAQSMRRAGSKNQRST